MADIEASLEKLEGKIDSGEKLTPEEEKLLNESPQENSEAKAGDEEVDPEKVTVEKIDEEKPSDTPDEKDEESSTSKKKTDEDAAAEEAERKKLIEEDAEKPLDEVDLKDYSPIERGLFFELRAERKKRQQAQTETDTLKFERAKSEARRQIEAENAAAKAKAEAEKEQDPFEGVEDDDLLTAGQLKKLMAGQKKEAPKTAPEEQARANKLLLENWTLKAQMKLPDVDLQEVTKLADEVLMRNGVRDSDAASEVDDVVAKGGNPLIATYNFLRAHPKFGPMLEKRLAKEGDEDGEKAKEDDARTNKDRAKRIEANKKKPVTTGSGGGAPPSGEYTVQELLNMSEDQFAKLPKSQRDRILENFG